MIHKLLKLYKIKWNYQLSLKNYKFKIIPLKKWVKKWIFKGLVKINQKLYKVNFLKIWIFKLDKSL